jgi:predicted  nucleic acid-binding Zn-ribbon protein
MRKQVEKETAVLGNFQITLPAPNGANVSISGYIYADESGQSLNERMDICREALVRQQAILEVPSLEAELEKAEKTLGDLRRAYAALLEKKQANAKMSSQDQANFSNFPQTIKYYEAEVDKGREKIAKLQKVS